MNTTATVNPHLRRLKVGVAAPFFSPSGNHRQLRLLGLVYTRSGIHWACTMVKSLEIPCGRRPLGLVNLAFTFYGITNVVRC